jgi:pyruvate, orthophosphate dikinase
MGGGSEVTGAAPSVFSFDCEHRQSPARLRALLGGKGFSLWLMRRELGMPVPPGFTIGTDECPAYLANGLSDALERAIRREAERIGAHLGKAFGDVSEPLLVSVRSGAAASMPGMMDTILNVGMTPAIVEALTRATGDAVFAQQSYLRFLVSFARIAHGLEIDAPADPPKDEANLGREVAKVRAALIARLGEGALDDPWAQLFAAVGAVFASWNSPRALAYRARAHVQDADGTAVTVQAMVFGNLDQRSGTGVAFTRNPSTGDPAPCGDFLPRAQGDDVVGGASRTQPLDAFARAMPEAYGELAAAMATLERSYRDLCDIEFTVERGRLWLLQARVGKRSPLAAPRIAVDLVREGKVGLTHAEAVERIDPDLLWGSARMERAATSERPIATGLGVSPGSATGRIVFDPDRAIELSEAGEDVLLVRRETSPKDVHGMGVAKGILTTLGGMMSHAAVVARAWGIPAVCGVENVDLADDQLVCGGKVYREGDVLSIDGDAGAVFAGAIASNVAVDPYLEILRDWAAQTRIRSSA